MSLFVSGFFYLALCLRFIHVAAFTQTLNKITNSKKLNRLKLEWNPYNDNEV